MDRFWSKVDKSGDCWIWTAGKTKAGYGLFKYDKGSPKMAHRVSYLLEYEDPGTAQVRHTCDNPSCVRPDHLVLGSAKQNMDDMYSRNRQGHGLKNEEVLEIRSRPVTPHLLRDVQSDYNIGYESAKSVIEGKTYSYLPGGRPLVKQYGTDRLSYEQIREIKEALKEPWWGQVKFLADKYGVKHSMISHIKSGYIYGEV